MSGERWYEVSVRDDGSLEELWAVNCLGADLAANVDDAWAWATHETGDEIVSVIVRHALTLRGMA